MKNLGKWLEDKGEVMQESDGFVISCPAHGDGSPSLRVALTEEGALLLHCRAGCDKGAVVSSLGFSSPADLFGWEAGEIAAKRVGGSSDPAGADDLVALGTFVQGTSGQYVGSQAAEYAAERFGITAADAARLRLGFMPDRPRSSWSAVTGKFQEASRLVVPFLGFDGKPRGLQGRALGASDVRWCGLLNPEGASWSPIAVMERDNDDATVLVTEGPSDALTAYAAGFSAVAVRGAALARNEALMLQLVAGLRGRQVVVCGDDDRAGREFSSIISKGLHAAGIDSFELIMPDEHNDLNDWFKAAGSLFGTQLLGAVRDAPRASVDSPVSAVPAPRPHELHPLTDLGNARRLRAHLGGLVRYAPEIGFFLWSGKVWVRDSHDEIRTAAHAVSDELYREATDLLIANDSSAKAMLSWAKNTQSTRALDSMVRELRVLPSVAVATEALDGPKDLLSVRNGVVNLRTGQLLDHDPEMLLTKLIDVDYKPDAQAPRWVEFMREIFPDNPDEMSAFMQRLTGYGITGHTSEQCFAVFHGKGANGKSVFTDTLSSVFEAVTQTTAFATFEAKPNGGGIPNDVAALLGSRLVMASEGDAGASMAESVVKRLTGQDLVTARFMRKEFFSFRPTFLIMLATNHKPHFRGADEGLWRRVKLIPFTRYFAEHERDHYLGEKLLAESEGILAWAVRGAVEWFRNGLGDPAMVTEATADYRDNSDALGGFYPGKLREVKGVNLACVEAYRAYLEWCDDELMPDKLRWSQRALNSALEERGCQRKRMTSGQTWMNMELAPAGWEHESAPAPEPEAAAPLASESGGVVAAAGIALGDA